MLKGESHFKLLHPGSIRRRLIHAIDDEDRDDLVRRLQSQAELFLKRGEDRGTRIGRSIVGRSRRRPKRCPFQVEIEATTEARSVDDATTHGGEPCQGHSEVRQRRALRRDSSCSGEGHAPLRALAGI